jgi:AcrR family transcriptional regulator
MANEKRPYRMTRRAELEAQTRQRIAESAVALHERLGPANTSISAVAEHAGVRRSTVYRHFPDERALFVACSGLWSQANPPPDIERWAAILDPDERLRSALDELYGYYRQTEPMLAHLLRDQATSPVVREFFSPFHELLGASRDVLVAGRRVRGAARRRRLLAATGHALAFTTWQSLAREQQLDDAQAAELMCRLVEAAASG